MNISGIYKIQSIIKPERIYIGSAVNINRRWNHHLNDLRKNKHCNRKLQNHFNKYKEGDLQFSILLKCGKEDLIKIEQNFIDTYNPYLNICKTAGNMLGYKHTAESNRKKRNALKGRPQAEEIIQKRRKPRDEQARQNMRDGWAARKKIEINKRPILQYDKDMNFIRKWDFASEAMKTLSMGNEIFKCLVGKRKTAGGFIWRYKFDKKVA